MGSRGRTSAAALGVPSRDNVAALGSASNPRIPRGLSEREAEIWREIMDGPCAQLIQAEAYPLLREYVALAADHERLCRASQGVEEKDLATSAGFDLYERITKRREQVGVRMAALSVKLRLAPSSRVHKEKAGTLADKPRGAKPWEEA